jgi:hypothetical protein
MVARRFVRDRLGKLIEVKLRGLWVETIVAMALDDAGWRPSAPGHWYDLERGDVGLEVKSSAALKIRGRTPNPAFNIAHQSAVLVENTRVKVPAPQRHATLYVFAYDPVDDRDTVNQSDPAEWRFWVVPTVALPRHSRTIGLEQVRTLAPEVGYETLAEKVAEALRLPTRGRGTARALPAAPSAFD